MIKKNNLILPLLILFLAILNLFFYWNFLKSPFLNFSDAAKFADVARQLVKGEGFSTNFNFFHPQVFFNYDGTSPFKTSWAPLFPFSLALSFYFLGISDKAVIFTSGLFFVLTALLLLFLGKKLFGQTIGFFASLVFIFTPSMLEYASIGASESLFIFLAILAFYLLTFFERKFSILAGVISALMFLSRAQAPFFFFGFLLFIFLTKKKEVFSFVFGFILIFILWLFFGKNLGINFYSQTPISLFFEHSNIVPQNITLRGGFEQFNFFDILKNIKPLFSKFFYHLYNFYKNLPSLFSPYLFTLFIFSLLKKEKERMIFSLKIATLTILFFLFFSASLTIPFMRYIHPIVPLLIIFSISFLFWLLEELLKPFVFMYRYVKTKHIVFFLIIFFIIGQTLGQIFLDSRYLAKTVNKNKPPVSFILGKIIGEETKKDDLIVTNLDTWGAWYGERRTVWLPFEPSQLIPPGKEKTKIDVIFLTSYLAFDPAQKLGDKWQQILDNPENPNDSFVKENFYLAKKIKILPEENYNQEFVYGVIFKRK